MDTATLYEFISGLAFLMLVGAYALVVIVLRSADPDWRQQGERESMHGAGAHASLEPLPFAAIERNIDDGRTSRAHHLGVIARSLVWWRQAARSHTEAG